MLVEVDTGLYIYCPEGNRFRNDTTFHTDNTSEWTRHRHKPRKIDNFREGHKSALPDPDSGLKEINFSFSRSKLVSNCNDGIRQTEVSLLLRFSRLTDIILNFPFFK